MKIPLRCVNSSINLWLTRAGGQARRPRRTSIARGSPNSRGFRELAYAFADIEGANVATTILVNQRFASRDAIVGLARPLAQSLSSPDPELLRAVMDETGGDDRVVERDEETPQTAPGELFAQHDLVPVVALGATGPPAPAALGRRGTSRPTVRSGKSEPFGQFALEREPSPQAAFGPAKSKKHRRFRPEKGRPCLLRYARA